MIKKLFIAAVVLGVGIGVIADTVTTTNRAGQVITTTLVSEGTPASATIDGETAMNQGTTPGGIFLGDYTNPEAPTEGFLTVRGTNLVFIATKIAGVPVSVSEPSVVVKAGVVN